MVASITSPQPQNVDTTSSTDSILEFHQSEGSSPPDNVEIVWCVTMPSETVLHLDSLEDFCQKYGKVLATNDINE